MLNQIFLKSFSIIIFLLFSVASSAFADYGISPVKLEINKEKKIASFKFKNNLDIEKFFQVTIVKKGKDGVNEVSNDLIATPVIFKVLPKRVQLVRITNKKALEEYSKDDEYRVLVKELPQGKVDPGTVKVISEFSLPIKIGV